MPIAGYAQQRQHGSRRNRLGPAARSARLRSRQLHAGAGPGISASRPGHSSPPQDPPSSAPRRATARPTPSSTRMAEDEEEPRRGRRGLMIVAALVGAIGLGGGMAYTYKTFVAPTGGRSPLIKARLRAQQGQARGAGRQGLRAHGQEAPEPAWRGRRAAARPATRPSAPERARQRRSQRAAQGAGSFRSRRRSAGAAPPRPRHRASRSRSSVPGVMLENMGRRRRGPAAAAAPPRRRACSCRHRGRRSRRSSSPRSRSHLPPEHAAPAAAEPAAPVKKAPVPRRPCRRPRTPLPHRQTSARHSGYVAVLSSQKSRMDALKAFADLQQKYGDVLASKTPDVQEANLGEKGVWYRARRRPARLARCGRRRVQPAQDRRLHRLLGDGVLTAAPVYVERRQRRRQPRSDQPRMLSAFITGLAGPSFRRARRLCCARRGRAA